MGKLYYNKGGVAISILTINGGISGAIVDPSSKEAEHHALLYYRTIRASKTDIARISKNTGFSYEQIQTIKHYLFLDFHHLTNGYRQFDPSFEIAESWRRLAFDYGHVKPHDLLLLKHELLEMKYVLDGYTQKEAHDIASEEYNYQKESDLFYQHLRDLKRERHNRNNDFER